MSSKKEKRKSLGDSKFTASTTPVPIETNVPPSTPSKPSKKRKNHASAEDSVDPPPAVTAAAAEMEETSKKRSKKAKEQDKSIVVDDAESKPKEGSMKSRKKEKQHDKLPEQTPTKSEQHNTRVAGDVTEGFDSVTEAAAAGKKKQKKNKGDVGEEASGSGGSAAEGKSKTKEKARSMDTDAAHVPTNQTLIPEGKQRKKSVQKVDLPAAEITSQPESTELAKTTAPAAEVKVGEGKSKKRKKGEEKVEAVVQKVDAPAAEITSQSESTKLIKTTTPIAKVKVGKGEPKKQKKGEEKVEVVVQKVDAPAAEITSQPESTELAKTTAPVEEVKVGEGKPKKRKKGEAKAEVVVDEPAMQPKSAKLTKGKQAAGHTAANGEPAQKKQKKQKKLGAKVGIASDEAVPNPGPQASAMATKLESTSASRTSKATVSSTTSEPSKKTKKAKAKDPSPEPTFPSDDDSVDGDVHFDSEEDDEVHLHGFSTDDDDSSDEEGGMDFEAAPLDVAKLPTIAKDDATVKRKLDKAKRQPTEDRGVLFIGRLPHGFYEDQLKAYFSQFGTVARLRVSRNKKTGRSKHYAFLEFDSLAVAQIVADTMDNYLLMGHILRCKVIPKDEVHPELWIGANRKWRPVPRDRITRMEHNKSRTTDEQARAAKRLIKRQNARKRKLAEAGIGYDFDAVSYKKPKETLVA